MPDVERSAWFHDYRRIRESIRQELPKGCIFHVIVLDFTGGALIVHIVRRIGEKKIDLCPPNKLLYISQRCTVSAHKAMVSKLVHIAQLALRLRRNDRFIIIFDNGIVQFVTQTPFKVKRRQVETGQLISQEVKVPIALVALIIHQPQGIHLLRCQIVYADARHFFHAQLFCRQSAAVADYNHAVTVNHNRLYKAVLLDALRNVVDLPLIMLFCVAGIRHNIRKPPFCDFHAFLLFCYQPPPLGYSNSLYPPMRPSGSSQTWATHYF